MLRACMVRFYSILLGCSILHSNGQNNARIPTHPIAPYVRPGDINLGGFVSIGRPVGKSSYYCDLSIESLFEWQTAEAIAFAIDKINSDTNLLTGINLGFVIVDACSKKHVAINEALKFYPASPSEQTSIETAGFDVVGVISGINSDQTEFVSYIMSTNHIPHVSFWATSDKLNSDSYSSYFLRDVPNDFFQSRVIVEFIARQGWSYFSVLYEAGSYGESIIRSIKSHINIYSMCLAASVRLDPDMTVADYKRIIGKMLQEPIRARVVVLAGSTDKMSKTFEAIHVLGAQNKLIWIGTDAWAQAAGTLHKSYRNVTFGAFVTQFYTPRVLEFERFLDSLTPSNSTDPWLNRLWELAFECSLEDWTCDMTKSITDSDYFDSALINAYAIDAVYVYAYALDKLLKDKCPGKFGTEAADCIKSRAQGVRKVCNSRGGEVNCEEYDLMLPYLKSVNFNGYTGLVKFDSVGNRMGKFLIQQILPGDPLIYKPVRIVDTEKSDGFEELNPLSWDFVSTLNSQFDDDAKLATTKYRVTDDKTPVSVCSRYCKIKEIKIINENPCCWTCRSCRVNEKLVSNFSRCEKCPEFQWPDESTNLTACIAITPTTMLLTDPLALLINILSAIGVIITIRVIVYYIMNRNIIIIKASSRELSFLQLSAVAIGFLTLTLRTMQPTKAGCVSSYLLLSLSYNTLYATLLVKSIRIYRLVKASTEGRRKICGVKPLFQIVLSLLIITGQLLLCLLILTVSYVGPSKTHPMPTERYVEFFCNYDNSAIVTFMGYNLIILVICMSFAYKNRKLPGNYSESHCICVFTFITLIMWITLMLAMLLLKKEYTKSLVVAIGHEIHMFIALMCLFIPRVIKGDTQRLSQMFFRRSRVERQARSQWFNKRE